MWNICSIVLKVNAVYWAAKNLWRNKQLKTLFFFVIIFTFSLHFPLTEVGKLQQHLSLLREQYVKLQERYTALEQQHAIVTAGTQVSEGEDSFVTRLLRFVADLYDKVGGPVSPLVFGVLVFLCIDDDAYYAICFTSNHVHTCIRAPAHIHTHAPPPPCTHTHTHIYAYVYMCVCVFVPYPKPPLEALPSLLAVVVQLVPAEPTQGLSRHQ